MAKNFEKLIFGGLHEKHAVKREIWVPTVEGATLFPLHSCAQRELGLG
jgi:hypothetical protein